VSGDRQYLRPTRYQLPVKAYIHPDDFAELGRKAKALGFRTVYAGLRVYLDVVANGLLMLPGRPRYLPLPNFTAKLRHFEVEVLSVPDVVISKLKPFRPTDIADIAAMIARGCVTHQQFRSLFLSAIDRFADGATGAAKLPKIVQNFNQIERDYFGTEETQIELPSWVDED